MEKKNMRVLAYRKAKIVVVDDLSNVSGGKGVTLQQTFQTTGRDPSSIDATDHQVDF